ncbi:MAG: endonuclease [Moheibacter sp.]
MKLNTFLLLFALSGAAFAQIPNGYYDDAEGLEGYELKTALKEIINGHTVLSYGSLNNYYNQTDKDIYYENDNTLLDMYSEKPNGPDAYNYGFGEGDQCGNYNSEADCWNKEHVFPQGFFNEQLPMRTDLHQVVPTDGYVNNRRSNYPFGEVGSATWTSTNGSKVGSNTTPGYSGTVFEPIDEFKGDIARIMLYFATRYEDQVNTSGWGSHTAPNNPLDGSDDQVYEDWFIDVLLSWHAADPVSQKEIDRNNKVYQIQGNRNPFVDHPEYVVMIWDPEAMNVSEFDSNKKIQVYPNPVNAVLNVKSDSKIESFELFDLSGKRLQSGKPNTNDLAIDMNRLPAGTYILQTTVHGKTSSQKVIKK